MADGTQVIARLSISLQIAAMQQAVINTNPNRVAKKRVRRV